jgi:hypothetical protein
MVDTYNTGAKVNGPTFYVSCGFLALAGHAVIYHG